MGRELMMECPMDVQAWKNSTQRTYTTTLSHHHTCLKKDYLVNKIGIGKERTLNVNSIPLNIQLVLHLCIKFLKNLQLRIKNGSMNLFLLWKKCFLMGILI